MSNTIHALDILEKPPEKLPGAIVLFGDESFLTRLVRNQLKHQLLAEDEDEVSYREFDGTQTTWRDVVDELSTVSLFNTGGPRVALVENAESFVRDNRDKLEEYVSHSRKTGVLFIQLQSWPSNSKLYKQLDREGLQIDCRLPKKSAKSSKIDLTKIQCWIVSWAKTHHKLKLEPAAAKRLLDLIGPEMGMLDQELAKLTLFVKAKEKVTVDIVDSAVGGWRCQSVWEAVDAALDGEPAQALEHLDRILHAGEHPLALFGQISWSLRRYGTAMQLLDANEHASSKPKLEQVLQQAGFQVWDIDRAKGRLRRLGRRRASRIPQRLLEADLALKGSHSQADRGRFVLEQLLLELGSPKPTTV